MQASGATYGRGRVALAVAAGATAFAVVAVLVWLLGSDSSATTCSGRPTTRTNGAVRARIVSSDELCRIARRLGRPLYWAGERRGTKLEYTQAANGSTYVRYLTGSAKAGDERASFVVVATYPQPNAYGVVLRIARRDRLPVTRLPDGGAAVTLRGRPQSVHLVYRGQPYQVEVYAPSAAEARRVALSGDVKPVLPGATERS